MSFDGAALAAMSVEERVTHGLALVPERRELFGSMTVDDNLVLGAFAPGCGARPQSTWRGVRPLPSPAGAPPPARRHAFGRRTADAGHGPRADGRPAPADAGRAEPGPRAAHRPRHLRVIVGLRKTGVSILLVEQNARAALQVADHAYVMELGEITARGPAAELAADPRIVESYLELGGTAELVNAARPTARARCHPAPPV